jgi:hypothetical protein
VTYDVRHYELPENASAADRATLRVWKAWVTWLRPILLASILMIVASAFVGTTIARSGGIDNGFVAVWSPANYAAAVAASGDPGGSDLVAVNGAAWTRGIAAQLASVVAAAAVAWGILRRSVRAGAVGAIAGLVVVTLHLTLSHQWGTQPITAAPASYQLAAVVSLWLLPLVAGILGLIVEKRRVQ